MVREWLYDALCLAMMFAAIALFSVVIWALM
jgi:hypothetical protein